jgi:penicillin-binding protein 1C
VTKKTTHLITTAKIKLRPLFHLIKQKKIYFLSGLVLLVISFSIYVYWDLPDYRNLTSHPAAASTKLLDRRGRLIYEIYADERRTPIALSSLPKYVWQATLAAEDKDFYQHGGFSVTGILRAFFNTFIKGQVQGGSTITQQLVKKALLNDDRTVRRKIREFTLSMEVETHYSKDQILELYLNQVPYGGTAYGLEAAAQTYFGKSSTKLTLAEAALLAGLPQAPSYYSPLGSHPELAKSRQKYVLDQMLDDKFITKAEYSSASAQVLQYAPPPSIEAPHFSLWVKDLLVKKYGLQTVEQGGLTVITTLDLDLQNFAQDTVASETAKLTKEHVGNGAVLITRPNTGEILGMVGSRDYFDTAHDGNVNVVLAHRQPGSSIKPVNYAIAFEHHLLTPSTVLADKPTCFIQANQKPYCPDNYDGQFHGPTQVRFALGNSFNIPAVKALVINGLDDFIASSSAFGITTWDDPSHYGPSLTLGGGEVTMLDLSTAYGVLANQGQRVNLNPLLEVRDRFGKILESVQSKQIDDSVAENLNQTNPYSYYIDNGSYYQESAPSNIRVISAGSAFLISHILYDNGARSATFGASSYLNVSGHPEVSVKTGTTNDKRDNWTIGYNPDVLVAVWVGNNDNSAMSNIASGVTGASPIWNKIMTKALKGLPQHWPLKPAEVEGTLVCQLSGLRVPDSPSADCQPRYEYFLSGTFPPFDTGLRRDIPILKNTNAPATTQDQIDHPDQIETQNHAAIIDPLNTILCLDCTGGYGNPDNIQIDKNGRAIR